MTAAAVQMDLFGPDTETLRLVDGLTCLRDAVPEALEAAMHLSDWHSREQGGFRLGGDWVYTIRRAGLRFERRGAGWSGKVSHLRLTTWSELAELIEDDPRRAEIRAWSESIVEPAWKERMRPHELWPNPGEWNPSYITQDHADPGWPDRIAAWTALQAMLTDAITALETT